MWIDIKHRNSVIVTYDGWRIRSTYDYPECQGPFPIVWHLLPGMPPLDNSCLFLQLHHSNDIPIAFTSAVNERMKLFYKCYKKGCYNSIDRQNQHACFRLFITKLDKKRVNLNIRLSSAASTDVKLRLLHHRHSTMYLNKPACTIPSHIDVHNSILYAN